MKTISVTDALNKCPTCSTPMEVEGADRLCRECSYFEPEESVRVVTFFGKVIGAMLAKNGIKTCMWYDQPYTRQYASEPLLFLPIFADTTNKLGIENGFFNKDNAFGFVKDTNGLLKSRIVASYDTFGAMPIIALTANTVIQNSLENSKLAGVDMLDDTLLEMHNITIESIPAPVNQPDSEAEDLDSLQRKAVLQSRNMLNK